MAEIVLLPTAPITGNPESQTLTGNQGGTITTGQFKIKYKNDITAALNYNATAAQIRDALRALNEITATGVASATGGALPGTPVVVNFGGHVGNTNIPMLSIVQSTLVGGTIAITASTPGVSGTRGYRKGQIVVAADTGVAYINQGTSDAPVWKLLAAAAQSALIADLTAATGSASDTIADVGSSFTQATLNNNFKSLAAKINALNAILKASGLEASS